MYVNIDLGFLEIVYSPATRPEPACFQIMSQAGKQGDSLSQDGQEL